MVLLEADPFLNELTKLFQRTKKGGTVFVTMKRTNMKPRKGKKDYSALEYLCLIRATDGKRKISTTLPGKDCGKFQSSYSTILKAHMDSLKKREKTKAKKEASDKQPKP